MERATLRARVRRAALLPPVGFALTLLVLFILLLLLGSVVGLLNLPAGLLTNELATAAIASGATLVVTLLAQGGTLDDAGFRPRGALRDLVVGFAAGALLLSLSVGVLALFGGYRIVGVAASAPEWQAIGYGLLLMSTVALAEEVIFRGILFRYAEAAFGSWVALALISAFFGAAHLANPAASAWGAAAIAIEAGIMLGAAYMLTRSLWLAIGIHWAWNFFQGSVFGINVSGSNLSLASVFKPTISGPEILSGGAFGIEASIIAVVICTLFGVALLALAVRRGQALTPRWVLRLLGRAPRDPVAANAS